MHLSFSSQALPVPWRLTIFYNKAHGVASALFTALQPAEVQSRHAGWCHGVLQYFAPMLTALQAPSLQPCNHERLDRYAKQTCRLVPWLAANLFSDSHGAASAYFAALRPD
ncbi:hypothetical protein WJX77_011662 [Trebouxia sp. C0004]